MKQRKKTMAEAEPDSGKKEISVAKIGLVGTIVVTIIGLVGTALTAYFSSQAAQAPVLIAIQATQTAEARIVAQTVATLSPAASSQSFASPSQGLASSSLSSSKPGTTPILQSNACQAAIDYGMLVRCEIAAPGEICAHTFSASQDEYVYVWVINENLGEMFGPRTLIYDPSGNKVSEDFTSVSAERVFRASSSGTYTIRVEEGARSYTGKYAVYLQRLRNPVFAQPITTGQQLRGSIKSAYQHNVYTFEANAGERVSIEVSEIPASGPLNLQVIIYSSDGILQYDGKTYRDVIALFTAPSSGTYAIFVRNVIQTKEVVNDIGEYFVYRQ